MFSLDNRRLRAFQDAGVDIPYIFASKEELKKELIRKFTTTNE